MSEKTLRNSDVNGARKNVLWKTSVLLDPAAPPHTWHWPERA